MRVGWLVRFTSREGIWSSGLHAGMTRLIQLGAWITLVMSLPTLQIAIAINPRSENETQWQHHGRRFLEEPGAACKCGRVRRKEELGRRIGDDPIVA